MALALPSRDRLEYARSLLEVVALLVVIGCVVRYAARVGPGRAATMVAKGKLSG